MPKKAIDITGQKFGTLTALKQVESTPGANSSRWLCRCDCGAEKISTSADLRSGHSSQCGCITGKTSKPRGTILKHGLSKVPEYSSWSHMKIRCYNKNCNRYERYGGRGIKVCDRWLKSIENFLADMGRKPGAEYSIDRIDNDANYSCGHCEECKTNGWTANCRWATPQEQSTNQRKKVMRHRPTKKEKPKGRKPQLMMVYNGEEMTIAQVSKLSGIPRSTLHWQLTHEPSKGKRKPAKKKTTVSFERMKEADGASKLKITIASVSAIFLVEPEMKQMLINLLTAVADNRLEIYAELEKKK